MRLLCISILVLLFASCPLFFEQDKKNEQEKPYKAKVQWSREFFISSLSDNPLVDGNFCYIPAEIVPGGGSNLTKIDLDTGKVIWESDRIANGNFSKPHKIGDYIYLPVVFYTSPRYGLIYVYNDSDGELAATLRLKNNDSNFMYINQNETPCVVSGSYIFWRNRYESSGSKGLWRLDTDDIDFSIDREETQFITPALIWEKSWSQEINANILSENGIIYFHTKANAEDESVLVAYNAETNEIVWEITISMDFIGYLILNGEKLHIISDSNLCVNKNDGSIIYYNLNETDSAYGVILYENRIYYRTLTVSYYPYYEKQNIVSLNAETGKLIWQTPDINKHIQGKQLVYGNKAYILSFEGLCVYDINNNGDNFIGIDKSISTSVSWDNYNFLYKDLLVFLDKSAEYGYCYLIAIKGE